MTRFGIEEEFALLDEETLVPVPLGSAAIDALTGGTGTFPPGSTRPEKCTGAVKKEFLTSQVEFATSPVQTVAEAEKQLRSCRSALTDFARSNGAVAVGTGTPFGVGPTGTVNASDRYGEIAHWLGRISDTHHVNGLHVHVEVPDAEARVRALNAVRPWLPVLLALSANSPFADGCDTGHDSWRSIIMRRLPLFGAPPQFVDADHYHATVDRLIRAHIIPDAASVAWAARVSARYPTLELRVFDAQLSADDTLLLATLCRALVVTALADTAPPDSHVHDTDAVQTSLWSAARWGMDATLAHPATGEPLSARQAIESLRGTVAPALELSDDRAFVDEHLARILREGNGAERQRAAYRDSGVAGLRALVSAPQPAAA
ncbi:carboxylate-amine ligase [Microbacterium murale]|uniref:Putative glutamate--cysteine ligase 2 n=1 Tax=Microbacterium murale TaxID=1081040 RepID=A0ABQ1RHC3_9MICO|nr:YbdK family carboxylate-amine ligase [Microbacterium murale]GGD68081.1 putative glutamate--cysteine ligase 2 [Microbacterium murale]